MKKLDKKYWHVITHYLTQTEVAEYWEKYQKDPEQISFTEWLLKNTDVKEDSPGTQHWYVNHYYNPNATQEYLEQERAKQEAAKEKIAKAKTNEI